jgi:KipI family sensor histidine kinase inhibitor
MVTFPRIQPLGDSATLIEFSDEIDLMVNRRVHALASLLEVDRLEGIIEWLPTYAALTVFYDPLILSYDKVAQWLRACAERTADQVSRTPRTIEVPTHYDNEFGPDLDFVAQYHDLSPVEVVRIHSGDTYQVFMLGFTPGFPYLGELSERIATPRLAVPRQRVPTGSVGIAARQTGIYPIESPGGWRIIGRTSLKLFDLTREPPFLINMGDSVKFVPVR